MSLRDFANSFCATATVAHMSFAMSPSIQSDVPLIHLADNLDEKDNLGWCIDTQGRGFAAMLHAHSCKPAGRGNDIQFSFDASTGQIRSVPYENKCMTLLEPGAAEVTFGLLDCEADEVAQRFAYDAASMEIRPESAPEHCVAVGAGSASAGPYMSRALITGPCAEIYADLRQWVVLD